MKDVSALTLHELQVVRKQSAVVVELCDAAIYGGDSNRHNAMRLIQPALRLLISRAEAALVALAQEG